MAWADIKILLTLAPAIIRFFQSLLDYASTEKGRKMGRAEAVEEGLKLAGEQVTVAAAIQRDADKAHAEHPVDDGGFDPDFARPTT